MRPTSWPTLHIANKLYSSWSLRPWLLMKEQGLPFTEMMHPFPDGSTPRGRTSSPFRAFSPTGQVPCLHDGEQVVWDSLAIAEYLAERDAGIWPGHPAVRAWARCAAAEMHAGFQALRQHCSMHCGLRIALHAVPDEVQADLDRIAELWRQGLERHGGPFLGGASFSAVDAFFAPVALRLQTYGLDLPDPAATYAQRLLGLPSLQDWVTAARQEPWREPAHEQAVRRVGQVLQDLMAPAAP